MRDSLYSYLTLFFVITLLFYILVICHNYDKMKQDLYTMYSVYNSYKRI